MITIDSSPAGNYLEFFAANRMTEETAFGLLHMLSHLRETFYDWTTYHTDRDIPGISGEYPLNRRVLNLLPADVIGGKAVPYRLKSVQLPAFSSNPSLRQLENCSRQIFFKRPYIGMSYANDSGGLSDGTLQLILEAGGICRELKTTMWDKSIPGAVDSIIEVRRPHQLMFCLAEINWCSFQSLIHYSGPLELVVRRVLIMCRLDTMPRPARIFSTEEEVAEADRLEAETGRGVQEWAVEREFEYAESAKREEKVFRVRFGIDSADSTAILQLLLL